MCHTIGRSIKITIGRVVNRLVGMGLNHHVIAMLVVWGGIPECSAAYLGQIQDFRIKGSFGYVSSSQMSHALHVQDFFLFIYYPPEVRRGEYWRLGVFLLQYFPLVKM